MRIHQHAYKIWLLNLVKEHKTLSAAAQEARISASAISQSLAQLEEALSLHLLNRDKKTISLTQQAEDLLQMFSEALLLFEKFDPETLNHKNAPKRIRIGAYESIAIDLLPQIIPILRSKWSGIEIELEIARSRPLIEKCKKGDLDLVFVADATHAPQLLIKSFATDQFGLFVSSKTDSSLTADQIVKQMGFGSLKIDDKHHSACYKRFLKTLLISSKPTLETESFEVILALVRGGALAGILPLRVAQRARPEIKRIDLSDLIQNKDTESHNLSIACHGNFSKKIFDTIFDIVCIQNKSFSNFKQTR